MHREMEEVMHNFLKQSDVKEKIRQTMSKSTRFNVNIDQVRAFHPELAKFLLNEPTEAIKLFEARLNAIVTEMGDGLSPEKLRA